MLNGLRWISVFAILSVPAQSSQARDFNVWLETVKQQALKAGISQSLVDRAFANLSPSERILGFDQKQPEFSLGFWDYYQRGVSTSRIENGRDRLAEHQQSLNQIAQKQGVQPRFLLAFWGLESDFGRVKGNHDLIQALATLAYDPRRSKFFLSELIQLLKIIDSGHIRLEEARGSWAGAFGHTQFMPSTFASYAVDGDQDGRIDLIGSEADALTSAANYLKNLGWDDTKTWGREVKLPKTFDYRLAHLKKPQPLAEWQRLGVRKVDGRALANLPLPASLILPAGADGPAFLVYENFHRIMRWNRSIFFALNVGLLSDAIAELPALVAVAPLDYQRLKAEDIQQFQNLMNSLGFDVGTPDGIAGRQTREALRQFQHQHGLIADGFLNAKTQQKLRALAGQ